MKLSKAIVCRGVDDNFAPIPIVQPIQSDDKIVGIFIDCVDIKEESVVLRVLWIHWSGFEIEEKAEYLNAPNRITVCPHISPIVVQAQEGLTPSGKWDVIVYYNDNEIFRCSLDIMQSKNTNSSKFMDIIV